MISKDKTYRTRDGREVRIYATDGGPPERVQGAVYLENYGWHPVTWKIDGTSKSNDHWLVEVKPRIKRTVWLNVFGDHIYGAYSKEHADVHPYADSRLACVKVEIDVEEGEGITHATYDPSKNTGPVSEDYRWNIKAVEEKP